MLQMLPMLAFADDAPDAHAVKIDGKEGAIQLWKAAVRAAQSGDTIILGEGKYTLYKIDSTNTTKGKDLTFVGQGPEVTTWQIGPEVPDPSKYGTEYNSDYSLQGTGTVTFKNMTLCSADADYLGFSHTNNTVVENCVINGRTFYWGYQSAKFINTTFNAPPSGQYMLWTYCSPTMEFDNCNFKATKGKAIYVHTDGTKQDITVYFNSRTMDSGSMHNKTALKIDDSNMDSHKFTIYINNPQTIDLTLDTMTCSKVFGFDGSSACNTGRTDVYWNDKPVWKEGKMQTHSYTDGEHDKAFTTSYTEWTRIDARNEWRDVTTTCDYCHRLLEKHREVASVYRLQYNLNEGVGDETANYNDANYRQNESVKLRRLPHEKATSLLDG